MQETGYDVLVAPAEHTNIASDKPTFRFGKKWENKNAENWD